MIYDYDYEKEICNFCNKELTNEDELLYTRTGMTCCEECYTKDENLLDN